MKKTILISILMLIIFSTNAQIVNRFRDSTWFKKGVQFDKEFTMTKDAEQGKVLVSEANGLAKWKDLRKVDTIYRNLDSIVYKINGLRYAIFNSVGANTDSQSLYRIFRNDSIEMGITRGNTITFAYAVDSISISGDSLITFKGGVRRSYSIGTYTLTKPSSRDSFILSRNGIRLSAVPDSIGGGGGGSVSISELTDATANHTIALGSYKTRITANSIAGDTAMVIASSSTGAASNLQNLLTISQSGANATSSQTTYGLKVSNLKTGTTSTNVGAYFEALNGATNYAVDVLGDLRMNNYSNIRMGSFSQIYMTNGSGINFNSTTQGIRYNNVGYMDYFAGASYHIFTSTKTLPFVIAATSSTNYLSFAKPSTNQNSIIFNGDFSSGSYRGETTYSNTINAANGIFKIAANTGQAGGYAAFTPNYVLSVKPTTCINLTPITATAASAITAAEGDLLFVSDTNGTFTSIGLWCYENGAWSKK